MTDCARGEMVRERKGLLAISQPERPIYSAQFDINPSIHPSSQRDPCTAISMIKCTNPSSSIKHSTLANHQGKMDSEKSNSLAQRQQSCYLHCQNKPFDPFALGPRCCNGYTTSHASLPFPSDIYLANVGCNKT